MSERVRLATCFGGWFFILFKAPCLSFGEVGAGIVWVLTPGFLQSGFGVNLVPTWLEFFTDSESRPVKVWFKIGDTKA